MSYSTGRSSLSVRRELLRAGEELRSAQRGAAMSLEVTAARPRKELGGARDAAAIAAACAAATS
jgi:hypothetical protein